MSFEYFPGIGMVHLNMAKPPRIVPGNERHKWDKKLVWGGSSTCIKCGCVKRALKPEYIETYQMPGGSVVNERPACTGANAP
jgi:hypothetical protein